MSLFASLLIFHSYFRWAVVLLLLAQALWLWYHIRQQTIYSRQHYRILNLSLIVFDIQLLVGWVLFFQSPLSQQFWSDPATMVKVRDVRFFGLEHTSMMTLAVAALHFLFGRSARLIGKPESFSKIMKWFLFVFLLIMASIPWSFSPFTHRPLFR